MPRGGWVGASWSPLSPGMRRAALRAWRALCSGVYLVIVKHLWPRVQSPRLKCKSACDARQLTHQGIFWFVVVLSPCERCAQECIRRNRACHGQVQGPAVSDYSACGQFRGPLGVPYACKTGCTDLLPLSGSWPAPGACDKPVGEAGSRFCM